MGYTQKRMFRTYKAKSLQKVLILAGRDYGSFVDYAKCEKTLKNGLRRYRVYINSL